MLSAQWLEFDAGTEIGLGIAQPLFELLQLRRRRAHADAAHEAAEAELVATALGLSFAARRAYADAQDAEQRASLERRLLRAAEIGHELMLDLHRAGNVVDLELTAEELALSDARLELARAESAAREAREPLNEALGLWGASSAWRLAAALPLAALPAEALETVESRALDASLDLEHSRARMRAQAASAGIEAWDAVLSKFELGLAAQRDPDLDETGVGPSLSIALPVFDTGSPARAAALGELRALAADHAVLAVAIRAEARRRRERVLAADVRVAALRDKHLPTLRRFVMDTLRNYNAMQIGAFDVVRARKLELDGERELLRSEAAARRARLELEELLAGRFARRVPSPDADDSPAADPTVHMQPGGGH